MLVSLYHDSHPAFPAVRPLSLIVRLSAPRLYIAGRTVELAEFESASPREPMTRATPISPNWIISYFRFVAVFYLAIFWNGYSSFAVVRVQQGDPYPLLYSTLLRGGWDYHGVRCAGSCTRRCCSVKSQPAPSHRYAWVQGCKGARVQGILLLGLGLMGIIVYTDRYTIFGQCYMASRDGFSPLHFSQRQKNGLNSLLYS